MQLSSVPHTFSTDAAGCRSGFSTARSSGSRSKADRRLAILIVASLITPATAHAGAETCPPEKATYAFDWTDYGWEDEPTTRTIYRTLFDPPVGPGELTPRGTPVRFETWRNGELVWSVNGRVHCHLIPDCFLKLDEAELQDSAEEREQCASIPVTAQGILEKDQVRYMAFGMLTSYSWACSKHVAIRVADKSALSDRERTEKTFPLPPYVRFESCSR
ncbi:hypothetical protein [Ensifer sp. MJa1]|uniref:hypothetical protein n=1 Tax=Ensifer sp. MJa1 TaxID=2919888 RepID=UPI0030085650